MMLMLKAARVWVAVGLLLTVQPAVSQSVALLPREIGPTPTTTPTPTGNNFGKEGADGTSISDFSSKSEEIRSISSGTEAPSTSRSLTNTILPTLSAGTSLDNSTLFNATIPDGHLPLPPNLTPGWGVAGVIMLITGAIYTLVGIKNRWLHTFFSTAYAAALGVAVLIVYVMNVPVSDGVQGGYVVATIMSGCIVGAAAMFFKELTEGFGCALGGFCFSMWILCLIPGGLLHSVPAKAIFIACFTLIGFSFYFSRYTRDWALIVLIAFAGSTITVLGIDCFSCAGLKEFWVYVWGINNNLFPLGADTYPVTKGIRVETAIIIIIFLFGVISQIKLWRIIREKREKRAAERAEDQRNLEEEEANVGRLVEEENARERRQWEQVYGDGNADSIADTRVTDYGDTGSEKKLRSSYVEPKSRSSAEIIEMADMSESDSSKLGQDALMASEDAEEGRAAEDVPESTTDVDYEQEFDEKDSARLEVKRLSNDERQYKNILISNRASQSQVATEAPEVVPLPFTVPPEFDVKSEGDRSSIATFADDIETEPANIASLKRESVAKRSSRGSLSLLRRISQLSGRNNCAAEEVSPNLNNDTEMLIVGKIGRPEEDELSLAATIDDESVSGGAARSVEICEPQDTSDVNRSNDHRIEIHAQLGNEDEKLSSGPGNNTRTAAVATDLGHDLNANAQTSISNGGDENIKARRQENSAEVAQATSEHVNSAAPVSSTPINLTKDRLPRTLSRVAMSYRTNEWAKHLSNAECPEPDALQAAAVEPSVEGKEIAAPVCVEELQQKAEDGVPSPSVRRSVSQNSGPHTKLSASRASKQEAPKITVAATPPSPTTQDIPLEQPPSLHSVTAPVQPLRKTSSVLRHSSSTFQPIAEEDSAERSETRGTEEEAPERLHLPSDKNSPDIALDMSHSGSGTGRSPIPGIVSYSSPQTLLGQREVFLRSKSQGNLMPNTSESLFASQGSSSDCGSVYNLPVHAAAALSVADPDDMPLSHRKEIMRQSSLMSLSYSPSQPSMTIGRSSPAYDGLERLAYNSHQPRRSSTLPTAVMRESQLASFRQSVQQDLRSGTPVISSSGRETPFATALLGDREAEVQRNIEMQRNILMGQKEAEAQRREAQRIEKEYVDRAFDERMRNGDMLDAHREAMRRIQKTAR